jgi:uncharacterized SAM-binding protein YcdF (DUF218 family)
MTEYGKHAIVVLGYSLNPDGTPHPLLTTRLMKAQSLYKSGVPIIVSGKMPPAQLSPNRYEKITEAAAMKDFLVEKGINEEDIFMEEFSCTTFANAFYTRVIHLNTMNIETASIVSNDFHMPLVRYCFNLVFGRDVQLEFIHASNEGLGLNEVEIWINIIEKMTTEIYPILFKNVLPGDLEAIHRIFNEAHLKKANREREQFESQLTRMLSLNHSISLRGFV